VLVDTVMSHKLRLRPSVWLPSRPSRYSLRQWNTWFALKSCRLATLGTEAPGKSVSATISRRSRTLRRRFFVPWISTCSVCFDVSTIPLCGHKQKCPQSHHPHSHTSSTHGKVRTLTLFLFADTDKSVHKAHHPHSRTSSTRRGNVQTLTD
jgi:hypothetical protein